MVTKVRPRIILTGRLNLTQDVLHHCVPERIYWTYPLAGVYACQGDKAKAFENLKIFSKNPSFTLSWVNLIKRDPQFDNLREDPEFKNIVRDVESKYLAEHEKVRKWLTYRQDIN